jgi:hypothetical protein
VCVEEYHVGKSVIQGRIDDKFTDNTGLQQATVAAFDFILIIVSYAVLLSKY